MPYSGSPPAATSLAAGETQALFTVAPALLPLIQGGRIRLIAQTSAQRTETMKDLPTVAESGHAGFEALAWNGLFTAAGTPAELVNKINADVNAAIADASVKEAFVKQGLIVAAARPRSSRPSSTAKAGSGARSSRRTTSRWIEGAPAMQALRKTRAAAGVELVDVPPPQAGRDDEVLVRVRATGICGSDLHVDDWTPSYAFITSSLPVTLGHEFVGVAHGGGNLEGKRVVVRPSVTCGVCDHCTQGDFDACERRTGLGMTRDGAFAPWVKVPARNCVPVPLSVSDELAALTEPLSISMQALRVAGDVRGQRVLVMGPGTIGQGIAALARRAGAKQVVVSGFDDAARFETLRRMGFDDLVDVKRLTLAQGVAPYLAGGHFDTVFEATGVPETINDALALLRRNGVVVVTGIHARPLALDLTQLVRRQQQLRGSFRPPESDWPAALELMGDLGATLAPMVSHVLPLSQALEGFALAHGKQASKVLLRPDGDE